MLRELVERNMTKERGKRQKLWKWMEIVYKRVCLNETTRRKRKFGCTSKRVVYRVPFRFIIFPSPPHPPSRERRCESAFPFDIFPSPLVLTREIPMHDRTSEIPGQRGSLLLDEDECGSSSSILFVENASALGMILSFLASNALK